MRILVIGAAGFIGSNLTCYAVSQGHGVVALCRSGKVHGFVGDTFKWGLGQPVPLAALDEVDCAVHLAHDFDGDAGARLTQEATLVCVDQIRAAGVSRQLFFSSYSAGEHACSLYGQTKLAIEQGIAGNGDVIIVRPGLVVGNGGIYSKIRTAAMRLPIVPLPDGGSGKVPVIGIEQLCQRVISIAGRQSVLHEINLFDAELVSLRTLVLNAAKQAGRRPLILPIPGGLLLFGFGLAKLLHIALPINEDNLRGFISNQLALHHATPEEYL
jgi:nucleoside-diphosphate-sugar epimerase